MFAWLLTISFLPMVGFLFYLLVGSRIGMHKLDDFSKSSMKALHYHRLLKKQLRCVDEGTLAQEYADFIHMNLISDQSIYTRNNHLLLFEDAEEKYRALLQDIRTAKESIHLEYFIIRNDKVGQEVLDALTERAKAGVEVRLLYDRLGSFFTSRRLFLPLKKAGGQVEMFYPSLFKINFRNHRKLAIIDGQVGYLGGMNLGEEYLGTGKLSPWRDTHLRIAGEAVCMMQLRFFLDWFFASKEEERLTDQDFTDKYFPWVSLEATGPLVQIVSSGPDEWEDQIKLGYIKLIQNAKNRLLLQTPYFIPDEHFTGALKIAAMSGVDVQIMIPAKPDRPWVYRATLSYLEDLMPYGVRVFAREGFLHSKMLIMDDCAVSIGSANMDIRSFVYNFETNAFVYDVSFAYQCVDAFERDKQCSLELTEEWYRRCPWWERGARRIMKLFSPIF